MFAPAAAWFWLSGGSAYGPSLWSGPSLSSSGPSLLSGPLASIPSLFVPSFSSPAASGKNLEPFQGFYAGLWVGFCWGGIGMFQGVG